MNRKVAEALDLILFVWPLLTFSSWYSLCFMEELRELKKVKRHIQCYCRKMKDESNHKLEPLLRSTL